MRGLVDTEVQADGEAEFSCELSQAGVTDVEWHLQGLRLQSNEVTEVTMQGDHTHMLRLKCVTPEDAGTVSFHVGPHRSSAQLTVRGRGHQACLPAHHARDWGSRLCQGTTRSSTFGGGELSGGGPPNRLSGHGVRADWCPLCASSGIGMGAQGVATQGGMLLPMVPRLTSHPPAALQSQRSPSWSP